MSDAGLRYQVRALTDKVTSLHRNLMALEDALKTIDGHEHPKFVVEYQNVASAANETLHFVARLPTEEPEIEDTELTENDEDTIYF